MGGTEGRKERNGKKRTNERKKEGDKKGGRVGGTARRVREKGKKER